MIVAVGMKRAAEAAPSLAFFSVEQAVARAGLRSCCDLAKPVGPIKPFAMKSPGQTRLGLSQWRVQMTGLNEPLEPLFRPNAQRESTHGLLLNLSCASLRRALPQSDYPSITTDVG